MSIDLGFDLFKKERVRVAGVDTPEKRTRDLRRTLIGIDATSSQRKTEGAIDHGMMILLSVLNLLAVYNGRLLGWLYLGDGECLDRSTNK